MPNPIMNDEIFSYCLEKWQASEKGKPFWGELAKRFGYKTPEALRKQFDRRRKKESIDKNNQSATVNHRSSTEMRGDGTIISDRLVEMSEEDSKNPKRLLELHGLDPESFELYNVKNNLWHMGGGEEGLRLHYQSKITAKPKSFVWDKESVDKLFADLSNKKLKFNKPSQYKINGLALLLHVPDLHLGMRAEKEICGSDYNMDIAQDRVCEYIQQAKDRVNGQKFNKIYYVVGNDFLNSDNLRGTTTKGTEQDTYDFWYNLFNRALEIIATSVNELSTIAPVEVVRVKSNHDVQSMYSIMKVIEAMFKGTKTIVDTSPMQRKYRTFGNSLLGFTHNIKKLKDAHSLMTSEAKDEWGECDYKYWFLAHLHNQMQYDSQGNLEIYRLPPFAERSRWTTNQAYVQGRRKGLVHIFDKKDGMVDIKKIYF